jgi:hypothetical protein
MRDPKRIKRILNKIEECWNKYPDFRLGQLLINATQKDILYYFEDDDLEVAIDAFDKMLDKINKAT